MESSVKKVMILGLDAPIAPTVFRYIKEGKLPNLAGIAERGVSCPNCLVPYPTITSSNWTTIATGAWPGTHGITGYSVHLPGDPLDQIHDGFDSTDKMAETLHEAAARVGKRSIIFDWPAAWPATVEDSIVIGGGGVGINSWRVPHGNERKGVTLGSYQLISTEEHPFAKKASLQQASGWRGIADSEALEAKVELDFNVPPEPAANRVVPKRWHLLLPRGPDGSYDRVMISESKDAAKAFVSLSPGEWSPVLTRDFETSAGSRRGSFRCKLLELSPDGRVLRLYLTVVNALDGWSHPPEIAASIRSEEGLPSPRDGFYPYLLGWIDDETLAEVVEFQHIWTADAVSQLLEGDWDIFMMHAHCPDWMYHTFSREIDPATNPDRPDRELHARLELKLYQSLDRMIGRILEHADENTLVFVVSDHGAKASGQRFRASEVLLKEGLTVSAEPAEGSDPISADRAPIDWGRTRAYAQRACYIYVNTKGRDPQGIVEPGEEYEEVRDKVIGSLYDYTDPETGRKPVTIALRREDARILGLYGDRVGDIVYALDPKFGGEHGNFLPTAEEGMGSMRGLLIMAGPGIRRGQTLERTVWLTDIAPTISHLADVPIPRDAEGGVIYQALEDPDMKLHELRLCRENYRRVMRAFSSGEAETHRRGV